MRNVFRGNKFKVFFKKTEEENPDINKYIGQFLKFDDNGKNRTIGKIIDSELKKSDIYFVVEIYNNYIKLFYKSRNKQNFLNV